MFEKIIIYSKAINQFKKVHDIVDGGFPFTSFKDFYDYYGYHGMLGFFLQFAQDYKFIIMTNNKKVIVVYKSKIIYNKELDHDVYDLTGRYWFGILITLKVINESLK